MFHLFLYNKSKHVQTNRSSHIEPYIGDNLIQGTKRGQKLS